MSLAYLFNWYPMPSQTALRREVAALEELGVSFHRFSLRRYEGELVDENDRAERERTRAVLDVGVWGLITAVLRTIATRPRRFARALAMAVHIGRIDERGMTKTLIYLAEACVLLNWFVKLGVEHVHTHYATNSTTAALFCQIMGGPSYSFTVHGPEEFDAARATCLRDKVRHAAFVVAISEFTRSQLYRWAEYRDWSKIHVIRVGVSQMFLDHMPVPIPMAPRLVNIGRIVEQKGQAILVQAVARLVQEGFDVKLVIVGDGPMRGDIEALIDRLGLRGHVQITGYLSNEGVREELLAARAIVLPSFAEGLPGVFLEALALGRPVVSTYIAAHPELIEPGVSGWLVPAGAVEPLVDAMAEVLTADPADLERMGHAGAATVARQHDVSTQAKKLADLFSRSNAVADRADLDARQSHSTAAR